MPRVRKPAIPNPDKKYIFRFDTNRVYTLIYDSKLPNGRLRFYNETVKAYTSMTQAKFDYACAKQLLKTVYMVKEDKEDEKKKLEKQKAVEAAAQKKAVEEVKETDDGIKSVIFELYTQPEDVKERIFDTIGKTPRQLAQSFSDWANGKLKSPVKLFEEYSRAKSVIGYVKISNYL